MVLSLAYLQIQILFRLLHSIKQAKHRSTVKTDSFRRKNYQKIGRQPIRSFPLRVVDGIMEVKL